MKKIVTAILLMITTIYFATPAVANMYKWVDKNGVVHLSDAPPPFGQKAETIKIRNYPTSVKAQNDTKQVAPKALQKKNTLNKERKKNNTNDQFYCNNVELVNGRIEGEVCNKTKKFFDEVYVRAISVDLFGKELWRETIQVKGLGPKKCVKFYKTYKSYKPMYTREKGHKLNFSFHPKQNSEMTTSKNFKNGMSIQNIKVEDRTLTGRVCNKAGSIFENLNVNIVATNKGKETLWKKEIMINKLLSGSCQDFSKHILSTFDEKPHSFLFSINKTSAYGDYKSGKINDEISYKDIVVQKRWFKGKICNDSKKSHSDVFIKFFALNSQEKVIWSKVTTINHIEPGQCISFAERGRGDWKYWRPSKWKTTVSGL